MKENNINSSQRAVDTRAAAAVDAYLEEYFFPQLVKAGHIKEFGVYNTKEEQIKKGDWYAVLNNGDKVNFDTKAYLSALNRFNSTFSLELLTKLMDGNGDYSCGFLLNCDPALSNECPDKKSTGYAAIVTSVFTKQDKDGKYIAEKSKDLFFDKRIDGEEKTNIDNVDIILVKISDIYDLINKMSERCTGESFDSVDLENAVWDIADSFSEKFYSSDFDENDRRFFDVIPGFKYSDMSGKDRSLCYIYDSFGKPYMPEDPLSLVISRKIYERLPHSWHFTVTDDGISMQTHSYNGTEYGRISLTNEAMPDNEEYNKKLDKVCNYIEYLKERNISKNKAIDKQEKNRDNKEFSAPDKDSELAI